MVKIFFIAILCSFGNLLAAQHPVPGQGILDLRAVSFSETEVVSLEGDWIIYPGEMVSPAYNPKKTSAAKPVKDKLSFDWSKYVETRHGNFENGIASYCLTILMPDSFPLMAVSLGRIHSSYELYLNGEKVFSNGVVSRNPDETVPGWGTKVLNLDLEPGENSLYLNVANFHYNEGGVLAAIKLGVAEQLQYMRKLEVASLLFLAGGLLIAGTFALGLFWFRTSDISGLLFFFFSLFYAFWLLNSSHQFVLYFFSNLSWETALRLEYISLSGAAILYAYYVKVSLKNFLHRSFFHLVAGISAATVGVILFTDSAFFTSYIVYYYTFLGIAFLLASMMAINKFEAHHKMDWISMIGILALLAVFFHKGLVYYQQLEEIPLFNNIGNSIFIFSQAIALAISFGRKYREQSRAALQAAETREEFLNTMSHELKTPMNAILGMSTFLENSDLTKGQEEKLRSIKNNAESLMAMINDILSISEAGSGKIDLRKGVLNIESIVDSALVLSKQYLQKDQVRFGYIIDKSVPETMIGDASRIKQLMLHLLSTVFKSMVKGVVQLSVSAQPDENGMVDVRFVLYRRGSSRIQDSSWVSKFFAKGPENADLKDETSEFDLIRQLVKQMGGEVHISQSGDREMMSFNIILEEYNKTVREQIASLFERNEIDRSLKILYAEDNPVNQKLVEMMLRSLGLEVDIANNGVEAVQMATKKYYNIILMDLNMPEMDGMEATRRIINNNSHRPIIIAATANMGEVDKHKCFEAGMNDFISKPLGMEELKLAIIKWQGLKRYLDDSEGEAFKMSS